MRAPLGDRRIFPYPAAMTGFAEDNAPAYEAPMTKSQFLRWVQGQEGRYELKDGLVVMQAGRSRLDAILIGRFVSALSSLLDLNVWSVSPTEFAVEIGDDIQYPDVLVERYSSDLKALSTQSPVLLVKVLSPSTTGDDLTVKLAEYTRLASLEAYVVASQDEPICWVWQRNGEARAFPKRPDEFKGRDAAIDVPSLAISLPLSAVYRGIGAA